MRWFVRLSVCGYTCILGLLGHNLFPHKLLICWRIPRVTSRKVWKKKQEMFQKHICPPWCKIQAYLLWRSKTCQKQESKGSKDIEQTTHWAQKSGLTLTFEHVTWKSIGIIYLMGTTPAPSLVLIKWRGQKILSGQHSGLRRVVWPWPLNMWPENQ